MHSQISDDGQTSLSGLPTASERLIGDPISPHALSVTIMTPSELSRIRSPSSILLIIVARRFFSFPTRAS